MFLASASKCNIEPNGEIFDVSPENDRASPNVKNPEIRDLVLMSNIPPLTSASKCNIEPNVKF